jgi:hypothetical protein
MTDESPTKGSETRDPAESDTEGHNMWINPGSARDLTRSREQDRQRELKARQRVKDAKGQR